MKSAVVNKPQVPFLAKMASPIVWVTEGLVWLTDPHPVHKKEHKKVALTGKVLLFSGAMLYAFGLSVESFQVSMYKGEALVNGQRLSAEEIRFMPKMGTDDGAELGRIIPSPLKTARLLSNTAFGWVPGYNKFQDTTFDSYLVWFDYRFYLSVFVALVVSICQAQAVRSVSVAIRKAQLDRVKNFRKVNLDPDALAIAKLRAKDYENAEVGGYVVEAGSIFITYLIELGSFLTSFGTGNSTFFFLVLNGGIQIFGFEAFFHLSGMADDDEEEG